MVPQIRGNLRNSRNQIGPNHPSKSKYIQVYPSKSDHRATASSLEALRPVLFCAIYAVSQVTARRSLALPMSFCAHFEPSRGKSMEVPLHEAFTHKNTVFNRAQSCPIVPSRVIFVNNWARQSIALNHYQFSMNSLSSPSIHHLSVRQAHRSEPRLRRAQSSRRAAFLLHHSPFRQDNL